MAVYMIIESTIRDQRAYAQYVEQVPRVIEKYGGRYLARGGRVISLSASWDPQRLIIIEFESVQKVKECFNSPEYKKISALREKGADTRAVVVEAC